jgi:Zn-finger protein
MKYTMKMFQTETKVYLPCMFVRVNLSVCSCSLPFFILLYVYISQNALVQK